MEQEGEKAQSETQEVIKEDDIHPPDTSDLTSAQEVKGNISTEKSTSKVNVEPSESVPNAATSNTTTAAAQPQPVLQPDEPHPVNPDSQNSVYTLPDAFRGIGGDICSGYGSLSRFSLHSYLPTKNFQAGAHYTLPFLRDTYASMGLSNQTEENRENPLDVKADLPAASYHTLGIHQFRPFTTMELLREPSRTR